MKGKGQYLTALRRGVGLGLVLTALWGAGLLVDGSALADRLTDPRLAVELLSRRLADPGRSEQALTGWGRLLLARSPLLAAGEEDVLRLRAERSAPAEEIDPPQDSDDQTEPDLVPQEDESGILEMTARGKEGGKYLFAGGIYLYNRTDLDLTAAVLEEGAVDLPLGDGPQILILHTHGSAQQS